MSRRINELRSLVDVLGESRTASLCKVHRTTLGRWLRGKVPIPEAALIAMRAAVNGEMPWMNKAWDGWFFRDGLLHSPEGYKFEPGQVLAIIYERKLIDAQRRQIQELESRLVAMTKAASAADSAANDLAAGRAF